jgi:hypothetical protein
MLHSFESRTGILSSILRKKKVLALTGLLLALTAAALATGCETFLAPDEAARASGGARK